MERAERRLAFFLAALRCPTFLSPTHERVTSAAFRRTLLLWLYAVYKRPALRLASEAQWAQDEPSNEQLLRWLQLVVGESDCAALVEANDLQLAALQQLVVVVETVHGRVTIEDQGDASVLASASSFVADLAEHQESLLDDRCEIFPRSIQMMANELHHGTSHTELASRFDDDVASLQRQLDALDARVLTARDRLQALQSVPIRSLDGPERNAKSLSQDFGRYLVECVDLIDRVSAMFKTDLAPWANPPKPHLVGIGQAAASAYESVDHVLQFLENTQSFATAGRDKKQVQATLDVAKDCQDLADRIAPGLRDQLHTLELALSMAESHRTNP